MLKNNTQYKKHTKKNIYRARLKLQKSYLIKTNMKTVISTIIGMIFLLNFSTSSSSAVEIIEQDYIVYMGAKQIIDIKKDEITTQHIKLVEDVCGKDAHFKVKHTYHRSFNGFVAKLTHEEASAISEQEEVVSVFPNEKYKLLTTRSWDFVGLTSQAKRHSSESDIIIGIIDSGIWPESESFSDHGIGPAPSKWKGVCQSSSNFSCNNKIIEARSYALSRKISDENAFLSPRDSIGHGTHTASTAAGVPTENTASFYGFAKGTARGAVPRGRLAIYKVCSEQGCDTVDILAAFDDAVADGVDIISISLGMSNYALDYRNDPIAIGSFHAMQYDVLTVAAVGNLRACDYEEKDVKGKIILCEIARGFGSVSVGVKGYLTVYECDKDVAEVTPYSEICLSKNAGAKIQSYINNSSSEPMARILRSTEIPDHGAPRVAKFSSRGPNVITPDILKPDITAPGVDILAAWPHHLSPTKANVDHRVTNFNIMSGTSMSCPHVSGASAYVKEFNPSFSPAAIKSAIMTTATPMTRQNNKEAEFAYGNGQINPRKAISPGLIYDITEKDYMTFLCSYGYTSKELRMLTKHPSKCPRNAGLTGLDLNYPSMTMVGGSKTVSKSFRRTLTNVGYNISTYRVEVASSSSSLSISVEPSVLTFTFLGQKLTFGVTVTVSLDDNPTLSGYIIWNDGFHQVRTPVVAYNMTII